MPPSPFPRATYPDQWQPATLNAHLYACAVNNPRAYLHHPHAERFLYRHGDGSFEIYDPKRHGDNIWAPSEQDDDTQVDELLEGSLTLERDLEDTLVDSLASLEAGLTFLERQVNTDVGRIDILARDASDGLVVVEIKVGEARDGAVGQIARYLGWYRSQGQVVRGILVAADFPDPIRYAASVIPNLSLKKYHLHLSFEVANLVSGTAANHPDGP